MGKRQKRFIAKLMIVLMVVSLLPTKLMGGGVTVKAATQLWVYDRDKNDEGIPFISSIKYSDSTDVTATLIVSKDRTGTFVDAVCYDGESLVNEVKNRSGLDVAKQTDKTVTIVTKEAGQYSFYFVRQGSNSGTTVKINGGTNQSIAGRNEENISAISYITTAANAEIKMVFAGNTVALMAIKYTPGYTVSGTIAGLDDLTGLKLTATPAGSEEAVEVEVDDDGNFSFFGEKDVAYTIKASGVTGYAITEGASISAVTAEVTDAVIKFEEAEIPTHTVTLTTSVENGSAAFVSGVDDLTGSSAVVPEGEKVKVKAVPEEGYCFASWTATGIDLGNKEKVAELEFVVGTKDITLIPSFEEKTQPQPQTLTLLNENEQGTVKATVNGADVSFNEGELDVSEGDAVKLIAEAKDGYTFSKWTVVGVDSLDADALKNPELEFDMPAGKVTVTAGYAEEVQVQTKTLTYGSIDEFFKVAMKTDDPTKPNLSDGNGCSDFSKGYKGDSKLIIPFTVPDNRYAKVTIYALGNGNNNADFSIKNADGVVVSTVAVSKKQSSISAQKLTFAGTLAAGNDYTLVGNGGKQGILYRVDVDLYANESAIPKDPKPVTVSGVITSDIDLAGGNITIANDTYGSFTGSITTGNSYTITNVKGKDAEGNSAEYSFLLLSSKKLNEAKSLIKENKFVPVTVGEGSVTADFEITYEDITDEWDFTKTNFEAPVEKLEGKTGEGTYKGLKVNATATDAKFAVSTGYVQINAGTTVEIPVPKDKAGTVTIAYNSGSKVGFTLTAGDNTADQTAGKVSFAKGTEKVTLAMTGETQVTKITIETIEAPDEYTITVADDIANGTVTVDKDSAAAGDTVTVTAEPNTCYKLESITVNGEAITGTTFEMPAKNATVSATFVEDHSITQKGNAKPATCIATGTKAYYQCDDCGKCFEDAEGTTEITENIDTWVVIEKTAHNTSKTAEVAATCIATGTKAYYQCADCKKYFADEEGTTEITNIETWGVIEKTEHTYAEEYTTDKKATATETGLESRHCTTPGCDAKTDERVLPVIDPGHTHETTKTAEVAATCIAEGKKAYYKCACGEYFEDAEGTKVIENFAAWVVIEKTAHTYAEEYTTDKEATATEAGSESRHCTTPGCDAKTGERVIPATGTPEHTHTMTKTAEVAATCIAEGKQAYYQCECGKYFEDEAGSKEIADIAAWGVIAKTAHTYAEEYTTDKAATATEAGSKSRHCTTAGCDAKTDVTVIPATGTEHTHTMTKTAEVAATCIAEGKQAYYKCAGCGKYFEDEAGSKEIADIAAWGTIAKTAHTYAADFTVDKEATATEAGSKSKHCTTAGCDAKTDVTVIPATGTPEQPTQGGLRYEEDLEIFKYYEDDEWVEDKYGYVEFDGATFLVANGVAATDANGLAQDPNDTDSWYFVAAGMVQEQVSDLVEYDGEWFYVESGKLDVTFSGYADYDGGKFLVAVGRIVREAQGLVQDPNNEDDWYYLADGQVVDYTGLALYDDHWFYVVDGKLDVNYVGTVEYDGAAFSVVKGVSVTE